MAVEMRGAAFLSFFDGIAELRGQGVADAVRDAVRPDLRERLLNGGITRVGWYPMEDYSALHDACDAVVGGGAAFATQLGRITTDRDTRGLLRYVLAFTTPELLLRYSDKVFGSYVRGATMRVEKLGPKHQLLCWDDFHGASFFLHAEWQGGVAFLIERAGGRDVKVVGRATQDPSRAAFEVSWA
jgi:hypothetical protein